MPLIRAYDGPRMKPIALHPYNREVIVFNRWSIAYAPAFGWKHANMRSVMADEPHEIIGHVYYDTFGISEPAAVNVAKAAVDTLRAAGYEIVPNEEIDNAIIALKLCSDGLQCEHWPIDPKTGDECLCELIDRVLGKRR